MAEVVDDGEKRDGCGRLLTAAAPRTEAVRAYRASGLTMTAFARQERIKYSTFAVSETLKSYPIKRFTDPGGPVRRHANGEGLHRCAGVGTACGNREAVVDRWIIEFSAGAFASRTEAAEWTKLT